MIQDAEKKLAYVVTIEFNPQPMGFEYALSIDGVATGPGRKAKVKKGAGNTLEWTCNLPFAIHFDTHTPLPDWQFGNGANRQAGGPILFGGPGQPPGQFKYWVAVSHDGKVYMDDPDVWVEP